MKKLILCALIVFANSAFADEDKCNPKSSITSDMLQCADEEYQKNDALLNKNYKAAMKACGDDKQCKSDLQKMQRHWIAYKEAVSAWIYSYGENGGGSLGSVQAIQWEAEETKKQAELLQQHYHSQ